jgi:hypothetical protein
MSSFNIRNGLKNPPPEVSKMARHTRKAHHLPEYANTMKGLYSWYHAKFEKLGWMVLAKAKGHDSKIAEYKRGLQRLMKSIEHVMAEYKDPDRIHDLRVLHMNTAALIDFVHKTM